MSLKKKVAIGVLAVLIVFGIINRRWVIYLGHLAKHQFRVVFYKERISERLKRSTIGDDERRALNMTLSIRRFAEIAYELKSSESYRSYYDLGRKELGYNITVAPALSLKPESFRFFPIGSFDYLGFFDKSYAEAWANEYRQKGSDVHLAEIGGYSTLGWFEDPLYSSQLSWGEYGLARLLAHEIAHEKLYFKDDTTFSELLASFIERKLAIDYLIAQGRKIPTAAEMQVRQKNARRFADLIQKIKTELETVYAANIPDAEKLRKKQEILTSLKNTLPHQDFAQVAAAQELVRLKEINNATLLQFHRYTPQGKAFENLFSHCQTIKPEKPYVCWFAELEKLKPCTNRSRKAWLDSDGKMEAAACKGGP